MYNLKEGERILSAQELATVSANERRSSFFPINTTLDFTGDVKFIGYVSSAGRQLVKFGDMKKNNRETSIPASMLMRVPFQNADAVAKTDFQKQLNACENASDLWNLIKGKVLKVVEIVTVSEVPYGKEVAQDVKYSVFDLA